MDNIKPGMFFISADGDGIGKLVGRSVLANDVDALHKVSARIDAAQDFILNWCKQVDGVKISGGGDEFTAAIPQKALRKLEALRNSIEKAFGYTISIGVGKMLSEAGTSLLVAKLRGKDQIVYFNDKIKADIKKAKRRVREGRASQEEYKLAEAYLTKAESMLCDLHKSEEGNHQPPKKETESEDSCPYCEENEDARTDDCQYCQDLDAEQNADGTAGMTDGCPACEEYDKKQAGGVDGCPYCDDESLEQADPGLAAEDAGPSDSPDNCPECQALYGDAIEEQPSQTAQEDPNLQGHETAEEVLDLLDQQPGIGSPAQEAQKIDNTELPQGDAMKENVSVKENFGDAQKNAISDSDAALEQSDEDPDMTDVLQNGLDEHANNMQKEKVLSMVMQTLQGFKANKASLEATKEQNQALYNSCIQMLKSMIELCKLLGLQPKMPEQTAQAPMAEPVQQEAPLAAAPAEGAAKDPKTQS